MCLLRVFCSPTVRPPYLAAHLRASEQISWRSADRLACSGLRWWWESRPEEKGEKMRREQEVKVKNGGKENTGERCLRSSGAGPHITWALTSLSPSCLCPPPPPLLCHSGLDYFILIRLIPPRGKLLITSPPQPPSDESNLLSAWGQDEGEGLLCLIGEKNVKGETEKRPWQQL